MIDMLGVNSKRTEITGKYADNVRKQLKENNMKKFYLGRPVINRDDVLAEAVDNCLDTMYRASYPPITLEELKEEAKKIDQKERDKARLFERHYLPHNIHSAILEDYADAYEVKSSLPSTIECLKDYFKHPVVDKWIEGENEHDPGHRGYDHPEPMPEEHYAVAEKFLDMANNFFSWNADATKLYFNVCNVSPCSNRETVEKWYHENGQPDFKIPEDDYWVDDWDDEEYEEENGE